MADAIELEQGEVKRLPRSPHVAEALTPLIARTDQVVGSGEELLVLTPGKNGVRLLPYGAVFHDYAAFSNTPIFELPDGTTTDWHVEKPEAPKVEGEDS